MRLRDIGQLIGIFVVVLFFATPVVYELAQVPDGYRALSLANPLTVVMEAYRSALYEGPSPDAGPLLISIAETALLLGGALWLFSRRSPKLVKEL